MMLCNEERFHQALDKDTPSKGYQTASGGGAMNWFRLTPG